MRATLGADRSLEHMKAHEVGETITHAHLRAEHVVDWATRGGAKALGKDAVVGSLEPGKKADVVLLKNDASPSMFPIVNPYGHVSLQANRGDVHTVLVNGVIAKYENALVGDGIAKARAAVEDTVSYLQSTLGEEVWKQGMNPEIPETKILDNPYQYTDFRTAATHTAGADA
jgi:urease alpha subunit